MIYKEISNGISDSYQSSGNARFCYARQRLSREGVDSSIIPVTYANLFIEGRVEK